MLAQTLHKWIIKKISQIDKDMSSAKDVKSISEIRGKLMLLEELYDMFISENKTKLHNHV
jgi:hypothetical protein